MKVNEVFLHAECLLSLFLSVSHSIIGQEKQTVYNGWIVKKRRWQGGCRGGSRGDDMEVRRSRSVDFS